MNPNTLNRYSRLTDHELYTSSVRAIIGELAGIVVSHGYGNALYEECKRRDRLQIWDVALDDAAIKVHTTQDNIENRASQLQQATARVVNIIRIDFCSDDELAGILRKKKGGAELRDVLGRLDGYYCSEVVGNSMISAGICDGDSLIVMRDNRLIDNKVQIIKAAGKYLVKRVAYTNDGLELRSESPHHGTMAFGFGETDEIEPLGVVRWVVKDVL